MSGIRNLGQNCFFSVVTQLIASVPRCGLELAHHRFEHKADPEERCAECLMYEMIQKVNSTKNKKIGKEELIPILEAVNINYKIPGDPRELFQNIVMEHCPTLQSIFQIQRTELHVCDSCHFESLGQDQFPVMVTISDRDTQLEESIEGLSEGSRVEDYRCPGCHQGNCTAMSSTVFGTAPEFVVLHRTNADAISIPPDVTLSRTIYQVIGFVQIIRAQEGNHYVYYRKNGLEWLKFDDSSVTIEDIFGTFDVALVLLRRFDVDEPSPFLTRNRYRDNRFKLFDPEEPRSTTNKTTDPDLGQEPEFEPMTTRSRRKLVTDGKTSEPSRKTPKGSGRKPKPKVSTKKALRGLREIGENLTSFGPKTTTGKSKKLTFQNWTTFGIGVSSKRKKKTTRTVTKKKGVSPKKNTSTEQQTVDLSSWQTESDTRESEVEKPGPRSSKRKLSTDTLGKRSRRLDGKEEPSTKYTYLKWCRPSKRGILHKSHEASNKKTGYLNEQRVPGYCILCPKKFFGIDEKLMRQHFESVHRQHSFVIREIRFLHCKCSDVRSRAHDGSSRNRHYHCMECFKPVESKHAFVKHSVSRHGWKSHLVEGILQKKK